MRINRNIDIPPAEISFTWTTSRGPGGQNVNKVETCAVLHFDVDASSALDGRQKQTLHRKLAGRINRDGVLSVSAQSHRTREANRKEALERFAGLLREALRPVRKRRPTSTPRRAVESRLRDKKIRKRTKEGRRRPDPSSDG